MTVRSARIQPMRIPPHAIFDIDPTVITLGPLAAIGGRRPAAVDIELGGRLIDDELSAHVARRRDDA